MRADSRVHGCDASTGPGATARDRGAATRRIAQLAESHIPSEERMYCSTARCHELGRPQPTVKQANAGNDRSSRAQRHGPPTPKRSPVSSSPHLPDTRAVQVATLDGWVRGCCPFETQRPRSPVVPCSRYPCKALPGTCGSFAPGLKCRIIPVTVSVFGRHQRRWHAHTLL